MKGIRDDGVTAVIVGWTVVTVITVVAGAPGWLRVPTVVPFVLVVVGLGWAITLTGERALVLAVAIGLSVSSTMIVAEAMALTGLWSPRFGIVLLAVVALAGAGVQRARAPGRR